VNKHDPLAFLDDELAALERRGLLRGAAPAEQDGALSFCSNDYLGLAALPVPGGASGSGASRLLAGEREEHGALERDLASWLGAEAALLFTSGYAANAGVLAALIGPEDLVVSDALNHASIIDGLRLARAVPVVVPHGDAEAVRAALRLRRPEQRAWVVVESYFSMDADGPDLGALRAACDEAGAALYVDEAHALGVMGPGGAGLCAAAGVVPDVLVGTLGKSLGAQGAFAAGRAALRAWLWNRARSFVFSTGLSPAMAAAARRSLAIVRGEPERAARVLASAARLRRGLVEAGARRVPSLSDRGQADGVLVVGHGHVVPIVVGSEERALVLAERLRARGVTVRAVRPPTVPAGTARVRLTLTSRHSEQDVDAAIAALRDALVDLPG
jgi:8-amino-7-oxononanoate synthase